MIRKIYVVMDSFRTEALRSSKNVEIPSGLRPIHELLTSRGWTNDTTQQQANSRGCTFELTYTKDVFSEDEFRIRTSDDKITVAVPIVGSPYLYASSFKSYYTATEFVGKHLDIYENKTLRSSS